MSRRKKQICAKQICRWTNSCRSSRTCTARQGRSGQSRVSGHPQSAGQTPARVIQELPAAIPHHSCVTGYGRAHRWRSGRHNRPSPGNVRVRLHRARLFCFAKNWPARITIPLLQRKASSGLLRPCNSRKNALLHAKLSSAQTFQLPRRTTRWFPVTKSWSQHLDGCQPWQKPSSPASNPLSSNFATRLPAHSPKSQPPKFVAIFWSNIRTRHQPAAEDRPSDPGSFSFSEKHRQSIPWPRACLWLIWWCEYVER